MAQAHYVIKDDSGLVVGWGTCDPDNFNAGAPTGLEWVSEPYEDVRPPSVPQSVTRRQFKQALTRAGLRTAVEAAVAAADLDTQDWYRESNEFQRHNPVLIGMAAAMGKTAEDIDALFAMAGAL